MVMTQGRKLIAVLKQRPMTYLEMMMLGISVCPWKRIKEGLREGETLVKGLNSKGQTTWRVR